MKIAKNDIVEVTSGANKGRKGRVLKVHPGDNRVTVEGVNLQKRHQKPRSQQDPGGIIEKEGPIHASNVKLVEKGTRP
ncbi:MAG: 50S ribosomal protein L24 [Candidatus Krumholzibacteria bacterium]|nr:50S ribosomal protein L24 [Candidatus Krumholzibacteria bacterium]MDP6797820.1 50S ribosomal protein L24 [Candidatus Krumholzibacteria bacterium]MDP7022063.1 50S ribosomal protein L24 [Candidatus Krumholzibacteria bacterium]